MGLNYCETRTKESIGTENYTNIPHKSRDKNTQQNINSNISLLSGVYGSNSWLY